jgi:hypothetical protein
LRLDVEINTESVYTSITLEKGKQLIVGALYRPPSSSIEYMDNMCTTLETLTTRHKKVMFCSVEPLLNASISALFHK